MQQSSFNTALFAALIAFTVYTYVRMRRMESRLYATDAVLDTLLAEEPPSEFLPLVNRRLDGLETVFDSTSSDEEEEGDSSAE
jgi:hypothetical protein